MSSSSALKYKIVNKPSLIAKVLAMIFFMLIAILLIMLWGISWISFLCLFAYFITAAYIVYFLPFVLFSSCVSESGNIEVHQPINITGKISRHSFYTGWVLLLCVEVSEALLVSEKQKHNKPKQWFIVFHDSVSDNHYRLLARLINSAD